MSLGGGGSAPKPPKLKTVDIGQAATLAESADRSAWTRSDTDWATRFPDLFKGREFMLNDALNQSGGAISPQATGALEAAGLGPEASRIAAGNEFETARNLGVDILSKENRDRNFAENLLAQNPPRQIGLSGKQAVQILEGNTGNANAFNQAIYGSQLNNYDASVAQQSQNLSALTSLIGGFAKNFGSNIFGNRGGSPYTNPFADFGSFYSGAGDLLGSIVPESGGGIQVFGSGDLPPLG